ncbi:MAG: secretin N-terminal domain-containing protein [Kiritimatiellales bacterium]
MKFRQWALVAAAVFSGTILFSQDFPARQPAPGQGQSQRQGFGGRPDFQNMTPEQQQRFREAMMQRQQQGGGGGAVARDPAAVASQRTVEGGELQTTRPPVLNPASAAVNWENVTLKDCIEVLSRDLGMEFVISPSVNVSQEVSVRAGDVTAWNNEDKLELFDAILETAGVQRVQRGRVWVFSPSDIRPVVESFTDEKHADGKPVIGVIKLKYIDASQAEQFLNTVGGRPPRVFAMRGSRMVLVLGTQQFLTQMEALVKLIDFPPGMMKPYALQLASSDDLVRELTSIFTGRTGGDGTPVRFTSVPRLNVIVAHNVPEGLAEDVERWIHLLDQMDDTNERSTRVYRLQVIDADVIGKTLDSLYSTLYRQTQAQRRAQQSSAAAVSRQQQSAAQTQQQRTQTAGGQTQSAGNQNQTAQRSTSATSASPEMDEEAVILADKDTNTLIINATPDQHRDIERTIRELDRPRRQVLIETVLVEVTLDKGMSLGIEWAVSQGLAVSGDVGYGRDWNLPSSSAGPNPDGFSYLLQSSSDKLAFIQAAETDDRLHVLASPTVLTRDGMQAEVSFGKEVPIQEKSISGNNSARDNYSYTYKDAKMTLTVTPVIDDNKMVTLNLVQVLRQIPPDYKITVDSNSQVAPPIFTTREISSNLQVENGQTLVLGGLIQSEDQNIRTGIPFLCRIPLIGRLFGRTSTVKKGSEILMILTPYVVDSRAETDFLTDSFRAKIIGGNSGDELRRLYNLEVPDAKSKKAEKKKPAPEAAAAEGE